MKRAESDRLGRVDELIVVRHVRIQTVRNHFAMKGSC